MDDTTPPQLIGQCQLSTAYMLLLYRKVMMVCHHDDDALIEVHYITSSSIITLNTIDTMKRIHSLTVVL
jgi:hypothetical protein